MKGRQEKKQSYLLAILSLAASPTTVPVSSQLTPPGFFSSILTSATLRDFSERPRPDFFWEVPTIVLSETSTQLESSPTAISGRAGGIQLGVVLRCGLVRLATHVTQSRLILPPNLFFNLFLQ